MRPEYLVDIFELLHWLDLAWDVGPQSPADMAVWSQASRRASYRRALEALIEADVVYPCACSRTDWLGYVGPDCPGGCRDLGLSPRSGETSWRLQLDDAADPVIWRRDDLPAYHLASVVDDDAWSVDLIVRGADLREATTIQRRISGHLADSCFADATVLHHDLIASDSGVKLSKSSGRQSRPLDRNARVRKQILEYADALEASAIADLPRSHGS